MYGQESTKDVEDFFLEAIFGSIWAAVLYRLILFQNLYPFSNTQSQWLLWGMAAVSVLLGTWGFRGKWTGWTLTVTIAAPFGLYTMLVQIQEKKVWVILVVLLITLLAVLYTALVFRKRIRNRKKIKQILKHRAGHCMRAAAYLLAVGSFVVMLPLLAKSATVQIVRVVTNQAPEETISKNMETLLLLKEDSWKKLKVEERLQVMQTVADIEAHYLGLPDEVPVLAASMGEQVGGFYTDREKCIYINKEYLATCDALTALNTCCHEMYHCYQFRLVEVYEDTDKKLRNLQALQKVAVYKEEFENYVSSSDDSDIYYDQQCEEDARQYAEEAVQDYCRRILQYQAEEMPEE